MSKYLTQLFALLCWFSSALLATVPSTVLTYPASGGSGARIIFQVTATDALGVSDIGWNNFSVGNPGVTPTCITQWGGGQANSIGLWNNNTTTITWGTIGTSAVIENDQCILTLQNSNTSTSGNSRMWNIDLTFKATYGGTKDLYAVTGGSQGHDGWHLLGNWTTGSAVYPTTTMSGSGGSGNPQLFITTVTDSNGPADILWSNFDIGGAGAANTCLLQWTASGFCLWNDAVNSCMSGSTPENSQCKLNTAASYTTVIGNTRNIAYSVEAKPTFTGAKDAYAVSGGSSGHNGWHNVGSWTFPNMQPPEYQITVRDLPAIPDPDEPKFVVLTQANSNPGTDELSIYRVNAPIQFTISNAKPNSQVWVQRRSIQPGQSIYTQTACGPNNGNENQGLANSIEGACYLGMTDPSGFFQWNGSIWPNWANEVYLGMTTAQFFVGTQVFNPIRPGITDGPMNESNYVGSLVYWVQGADGLPLAPEW